MMKTMSITFVALAGLTAFAGADINAINGSTLNGAEGLYDSLTTTMTGFRSPVPGDTFDARALLQDGTNAFFIDGAPDTHTFPNPAGEFAGTNSVGNPGNFFGVLSAHTILGGGTEFIQVEMANFQSNGTDLSAWQPTPGLLSDNLIPYTSWRLDVGTITGSDPIAWSSDFRIVDSGFTIFDSDLNSLGTFALTVNGSTANSLAGVAVVGLGGADIGGFDMASIQLFWEIEKVPAPGAMALLGLGGLVATRRRR